MDRFIHLYSALVGLALLSSALAQPPADVPPPPPPPPDQIPSDGSEMKERWHKLSPEERERFSKNFQKWEHLSDEEKKRLRERGRQAWEQGRKEVDRIAAELGAELSPQRREELIKAYLQKRREIERKIREETEPRRQKLIAEAIEELKKEFATNPETTAPEKIVIPD